MNHVHSRRHHGAEVDIAAIREDFPALQTSEVYLDSAATSLTPTPVVEAMVEYYLRFNANVNRGSYRSSLLASERYEAACARIAAFVGAAPGEIVLTQNATYALNILAWTLDLEAGDEIIISTVEHQSNMVPWVSLVQTKGVKVVWYDPGKYGDFDADALAELFTDRTKLVALTWVSNVLGSITPVADMVAACRARGVEIVIDACQAAPHFRIDVHSLDCDYLVYSGHKMLGPTGIGVLYMKRERMDEYRPPLLDAESVATQTCPGLGACGTGGMPAPKWVVSHGTPPIAEALGLARAMDYIDAVGFDAIQAHDAALMRRALDGLREIPGIDIFGPGDLARRASIVSFNVGDLPAEEVGRILFENFGIGVRAGTQCALGLFLEVQDPGMSYGNVRASFYLYNTEAEIDAFVAAVRQVAELA